MSRMQRDKGARIERDIVELHRGLGLRAEPVPLSGAARYQGNGAEVGIYPFGPDEAPLCGEVKGRGTAVLQAEIACLKTELEAMRRAGGGSTFTPHDKPEDIDRAIVGDLVNVTAGKLRRIVKEIAVAIEVAVKRKEGGGAP
jgi:hypothetical protein